MKTLASNLRNQTRFTTISLIRLRSRWPSNRFCWEMESWRAIKCWDCNGWFHCTI